MFLSPEKVNMAESTGRRSTGNLSDESIRNFCGSLDALAFLSVDQVATGKRALKEAAPEETMGLVDYFDSTYVTGSYRSV